MAVAEYFRELVAASNEEGGRLMPYKDPENCALQSRQARETTRNLRRNVNASSSNAPGIAVKIATSL